MCISKETISNIKIEDFTPDKIVHQLSSFPEIFNFLKSKEKEMGKIRPIITYLTAISIWTYKETTSIKRDIPPGFFHGLWNMFQQNKDIARSVGNLVEELESDLWGLFLSTIKSETTRDKNISKHEVGVGALVFSLVIIGLLFVFGDEKILEKLNKSIIFTE